ncbi:sensor histidine kinase [Deinococcus aquaticus]|uniref:sensor histidine kinase n=1 Tax=Deinococcus aquaticus TaxID=328692 RepID=UPI0036079A10
MFQVHDNGIGIEPEYHERIFGVFQRLHGMEDYPGSGIGLAVTRSAAEQLGGHLWVDSVPGAGSTFSLALPAQAPVRPEPSDLAATFPAASPPNTPFTRTPPQETCHDHPARRDSAGRGQPGRRDADPGGLRGRPLPAPPAPRP